MSDLLRVGPGEGGAADCYTPMCKAVDGIVASFKKNSVIGTPECISIYKSNRGNTLQCTAVSSWGSDGQLCFLPHFQPRSFFRGRLGHGHIVESFVERGHSAV